jgi:hypothetical protein
MNEVLHQNFPHREGEARFPGSAEPRRGGDGSSPRPKNLSRWVSSRLSLTPRETAPSLLAHPSVAWVVSVSSFSTLPPPPKTCNFAPQNLQKPQQKPTSSTLVNPKIFLSPTPPVTATKLSSQSCPSFSRTSTCIARIPLPHFYGPSCSCPSVSVRTRAVKNALNSPHQPLSKLHL